jgi:hypothetical protein
MMLEKDRGDQQTKRLRNECVLHRVKYEYSTNNEKEEA